MFRDRRAAILALGLAVTGVFGRRP